MMESVARRSNLGLQSSFVHHATVRQLQGFGYSQFRLFRRFALKHTQATGGRLGAGAHAARPLVQQTSTSAVRQRGLQSVGQLGMFISSQLRASAALV